MTSFCKLMARLVSMLVVFMSVCTNPILSVAQSTYVEFDSEQNDSIYHALYPPIYPKEVKINSTTSTDTGYSTVPKENNSSVPISVDIDRSKAVGQISINSGVTPTGAKTYSIPISVPAGINNITTPQLVLSYNSQQRGGHMGEGWSLAGLSSITRTQHSLYYDNYVYGISLSGEGPFCIDGIRLIRVSGNGTVGSYKSEYGNIYVKAYFDTYKTLYFDVFYPNGCKAVFGYKNNTETRLTYPITEFYDSFGNKIEYQYNLIGNNYYVSKILYNNAAVVFSYQTKNSNKFSTYIGGVEVQHDMLLSEIKTSYNNLEIGKYTLTYKESAYKYLLSEVGFSASGLDLNPLKFYYGDGSVSKKNSLTGILTNYYSTNGKAGRIVAARGRFNYRNGEDAVIFYPNEVSHWNIQELKILSVINSIVNYYTGDENIYIYGDLDINPDLKNNVFSPIQTIKTGEGFIAALFADLTGKQQEYLVKINNYVYNSMDKVVFSVYEYNGFDGISLRYRREFILGAVQTNVKGKSWPQPKHFKVGDFDGDGRMEMMAMSINSFGSNSKCYIFDLEAGKKVFESNILEYRHAFLGNNNTNPLDVSNSSDKLLVGDFDGDGKHELCHIDKSNTKIYSFQVNADGTWHSTSTVTNFSLSRINIENKNIYTSDINADGMTDLIFSPKNDETATDWKAYFSKGDGYSFSVKYFNGPKNYVPENYGGYMFFDYDHDGVEDLVGYNNLGLYIYPSNRNFYDLNELIGESYSGNATYVPTQSISRNTFSSILWIDENQIHKNNYSNNILTKSLCTGMSNSFGVIERNDYALTNDKNSGVCTAGNSSVYPYVDFMENMPVVKQVRSYHRGAEINSDIYTYESPVFHRQGLGFVGFKNVQRYSNNRHVYNQTYDPYRRGLLVLDKSDSKTHKYCYTVKMDGKKCFDILLDSVISTDHLKNITTH